MSQTLIDFYNSFFDTLPIKVNTATLAQKTKLSFQNLVIELQNLLARQREYPFLNALILPLEQVEKLAGQPAAFFVTDFHPQIDELLNTKDTVLVPIRRFMTGEQKTIYDNCQSFLYQHKENLAFVQANELNDLRKILSAPDCYLEDKMFAAQKYLRTLQKEIEHLLIVERQQVILEIDKRKDTLLATEEYQKLPSEQQQQIASSIETVSNQLAAQNTIVAVRNYRRNFVEEIYPALLSQLQARKTISLYATCSTAKKYLLTNEKETDEFLSQLKQIIMEEIEKGNTISL